MDNVRWSSNFYIICDSFCSDYHFSTSTQAPWQKNLPVLPALCKVLSAECRDSADSVYSVDFVQTTQWKLKFCFLFHEQKQRFEGALPMAVCEMRSVT
jgi:hypothetical protein